MRRVTVTAYGSFSFSDFLGLEAQNVARGVPFISQNFVSGDVKTFDVTESQWNRLLPVLEKLSQRYALVLDPSTGLSTNKYRAVMTYSVETIPGNRARVFGSNGSISLASATNAVKIYGENLIRGYAAAGSTGSGTAKINFAAARKGPEGNNIVINIKAAYASGTVTTTTSQDMNGFKVVIDVVPASGSSNSNAIASQMNSSAPCAFYVTATGNGTGAVNPVSGITLSGGEGAATAHLVLTNSFSERLIVQARKPGVSGSQISLVLSAASGGGSVSVSGNKITVVPAAASNTVTAVVSQINGNTAAAALVVASGTGTHAPGTLVQTYLHGGSGEDVVVKGGNVTGKITAHTDTEIDVTVDGTAVTNLVNGDQGLVNIVTGYGNLLVPVPVVS